MLLLVLVVFFALLPILQGIKKNKIVLSVKNIRINLIMLYPIVCTCVLAGIPCGLYENQYKSLFLMGSDKAFGGRDALLETHGSVEIHDHVYYHDNKFIPQGYHVFWGFEDERLFSFAKHELETLSADEPFFLGLLTVDTHSPEGYKCEKCPSTEESP